MQTMQIEVINVSVKQETSKMGKPYQVAEVTYKNKSFQDKVEAKKIMSFTPLFGTLKDAQFGDVFNINREKNEQTGFWDWVSIADNQFNQKEIKESNTMIGKTNVTPKSTYETAEERAHRQVLIVRQSSVSSAIAALKTDKLQLDANSIIDLARKLEAYVMQDLGGTDKFESMAEDPL